MAAMTHRNALLLTGKNYSVDSVPLIWQHLVEPHALDVFIIVTLPDALHDPFRQLLAPWGDRIKLLELIPASAIQDAGLLKGTESMFAHLAEYLGTDKVETLQRQSSIPGIINQFSRVADGCLRLMQYATQHQLTYRNVLRWRLDFSPSKTDLRGALQNLGDNVAVLSRNGVTQNDAACEFVLAPWDWFLRIYLSFPRFLYYYWPLYYDITLVTPEIQFAQHLRRLAVPLWVVPVQVAPAETPDRHWTYTFSDHSWELVDRLTLTWFCSDSDKQPDAVKMPSLMILFDPAATTHTNWHTALNHSPNREPDPLQSTTLAIAPDTVPVSAVWSLSTSEGPLQTTQWVLVGLIIALVVVVLALWLALKQRAPLTKQRLSPEETHGSRRRL